ncbi:MAG: hypothetical protein RLN84_08280, partial [Rhodospirillaceae bacterium]
SKATLHNNGSIVGYYGTANGGNGGHAVKTDIPLSVANFGVIYAGGGGGVNGAARSATGTYYLNGGDECNSRSETCTASGGNGGRGAGWYTAGTTYQSGASGSGGLTCVAGNYQVTGDCSNRDGRTYATGDTGGSGGAFGSDAQSGGTGGVAFNAYRLVTFAHSGLWSGGIINDASPAPDEGNTDPVEDADYLLTIAAHAQDYSVVTELLAAGWDGVTPTSVKVVVEQDIVVGGSSTSGYALNFNGLPEGSNGVLVNNGDIVGRYGAPNSGTGGNAVSTGVSLRLYNFGRIYAGGGAGAKGANRTAHGINYVSSGEQCNGNRVSCVASGGSGGRGAGWYALGNIYETGSSGASGSTCSAGGGNVTGECSGRSGAVSATGSTGTTGGGLGFEADVGGAAGYAFSGFNLIDFVVPGEWGGRIANN